MRQKYNNFFNTREQNMKKADTAVTAILSATSSASRIIKNHKNHKNHSSDSGGDKCLNCNFDLCVKGRTC
jgi:hypothetical protein